MYVFRPRHSIRLFWIGQLTHRDGAIRPTLRGRLNPQWFTLCGNPRTFGDPGFHRKFRYSCQHSHFWSLQQPLTSCLQQVTERSATPIKKGLVFLVFFFVFCVFYKIKNKLEKRNSPEHFIDILNILLTFYLFFIWKNT